MKHFYKVCLPGLAIVLLSLSNFQPLLCQPGSPCDSIFWVFLDSTAGAINKYPNIALMGNFNVMPIYSGIDDGQGNTCIRIDWNGNNASEWGGGFFFPVGESWNSTNGFDLTDYQRLRFKAKITLQGNVKFLIGKTGDSSGELTKTLTVKTDWEWYTWELPANLDYSNIVGGFGWALGGDQGTPTNSKLYLDSIHYEGCSSVLGISETLPFLAPSAFPNPFYDQTTLQFSLPKAAHVELSIYDMKGKKVRTLINARKAPGLYIEAWNGKGNSGDLLPAGAYACVLCVGDKKLSVVLYKL